MRCDGDGRTCEAAVPKGDHLCPTHRITWGLSGRTACDRVYVAESIEFSARERAEGAGMSREA